MTNLRAPLDRRKRLFLIMWVLQIAFFLWKARIGFGSNDESLYLAIPHRLYQGDGMISNEWSPSMISSWFMYPLFWVYMKLVNSTEGIILAFRYLYVAVQATISLFLYHKIEERPGAPIAVLFWTLYTPFNIMALCYNTIGIMGMTIFTVLLICEKKKRWYSAVVAGIALSGAVLGCPYLVIVYLYYAFLVFWHRHAQKDGPSWGYLFEFEGFAYVTLTCAAMAGLLVISILRKASLSCVIETIPLILTIPDHNMSFARKAWRYFYSVFEVNRPAMPILILMALTYAGYCFDRKRKCRKAWYFAAFCVLSCFYAGIILRKVPHVNHMVIPVILLGFFCFRITEQKDMVLLLGGFLPAVLYTVAIHWASNVEYLAIFSAMAVGIIPSVLCIFNLTKELPSPKFRTVGLLAICVLMGGMFWSRAHDTFGDKSPRYLNVRIEEGPSRGVYTTQEKADAYNSLQKATELVREKEEGRVLYFSRCPILPLGDEKRMSGYCPWLFNGSDEFTMERLKTYYAMHPDCIPDWVFVDGSLQIPAEELLAVLELNGTVIPRQGHEVIQIEK